MIFTLHLSFASSKRLMEFPLDCWPQSMLVQSREANFGSALWIWVCSDAALGAKHWAAIFSSRSALVALGWTGFENSPSLSTRATCTVAVQGRDYHFIEMPPTVGFGPYRTQVLGNYWPEFKNPPTDRFIADDQSALSQKVLDIPIAQRDRSYTRRQINEANTIGDFEIGWPSALGSAKVRVPSRIVEHEQDDAAQARFGLARKGFEQSLEEFLRHAVGNIPEGLAGGR